MAAEDVVEALQVDSSASRTTMAAAAAVGAGAALLLLLWASGALRQKRPVALLRPRDRSIFADKGLLQKPARLAA